MDVERDRPICWSMSRDIKSPGSFRIHQSQRKSVIMRGVNVLSSARSSFNGRTSILMMGAILAVAFGGCADSGPKLGVVTGKVTFEGKPVPAAYVVFQPIDRPGTYGSAYTGDDGQYVLRYSRNRNGALVGRHQVTITTNPDGGDDETVPEEKPARRGSKGKGQQNRMKGIFEREVKPGKNVHDFDLGDQEDASSR